MNVAFRVDASARMGTGHLMRCLTLALALRERGARTMFVCRDHPGNLVDLVRRHALPVVVLPAAAPAPRAAAADDYAAWVGTTQRADADQTRDAWGGDRPDWVIVDHYGLDAEWERALRPHAGRVMALDDLPSRHHDCDLLFDQNYAADGAARPAGLVPEHCRLLLGPRFALVGPAFLASRRTARPRDGSVRRVLVFVGGSDPQDLSGVALDALAAPALAHLDVELVIGANHPDRAALEARAAGRPRTRCHGMLPDLAAVMTRADLAVGAGGGTLWERMCVGLPAVVVSLAENQRAGCEALARAGLIRYAGDVRAVRAPGLGAAIEACLHDRDALAALAARNRLLVDGLGAARVAEALDPTAIERLRLRPATPDDAELYFQWVNDPAVRRQSLATEPITWERHHDWFAHQVADARSRLFVLMAGTLPVGQIRFNRGAVDARIDYSLDSLVRGRGWGTRLVALGCALMQRADPVRLRADVKPDNRASRAVFARLGFASGPPATPGLDTFYRDAGAA